MTRDAQLGVMSVADANGQVVENITMPTKSGASLWTAPIIGPGLELRVTHEGNTEFPLIVDAQVVDKKNFDPETLIDQDELLDIALYNGPDQETVRQVAQSIGKLTYIKFGVSFDCSGFLVSNDLFMTNDHCVNDKDTCESASIAFGYEKDLNKNTIQGEIHRCSEVIKSDYPLDFSVIRLQQPAGQKYGFLKLHTMSSTIDQSAYIIQHPEGLPKKVSIDACVLGGKIVQGRRHISDRTHTCDTLKGSSGSPVLNQDGQVVALHHLGKSSRIQDFFYVNRAVDSGSILHFLKENGISLESIGD
ncbi:trypsin-like serine peptidase [Rhizobium laguerreae]|uniref:trypsin-like serine peptidase n=1 Tax=Rhizobium laguerreae TaxID=1076926 RepID=UPI001C90C330|nr:serine protease [Rhizobium laguerreae]MBY3198219.1 trypsin-like serine protease [Rhizobium laguerreae]